MPAPDDGFVFPVWEGVDDEEAVVEMGAVLETEDEDDGELDTPEDDEVEDGKGENDSETLGLATLQKS